MGGTWNIPEETVINSIFMEESSKTQQRRWLLVILETEVSIEFKSAHTHTHKALIVSSL